jgi:hypothetical protein
VRVSPAVLIKFLGYIEVVLCIAALCFLVFRRQWRDYWALGTFLAVRAVSDIVLSLIWLEALHRHAGVDRRSFYDAYFYIYWGAYLTEAILGLVILYSIFRLTTAPLQGLQRLGMRVLGGLAAISVLLAFVSAFAPHSTSHQYLMEVLSQLRRVQGVLTLCLVLFVCFAIRPLGLSFKSNIFGVSLGLAVLAIMNLVESSWLVHNPRMSWVLNLVSGGVVCAVMAIWAGYFAAPEPERREVVLPPSSVFARLNRMALGWWG